MLFHVGDSIAGEIVVQSLDSVERKVLFPGVSPRYVPTGHIVYGLDGVLFGVPFDLDTLEVTGGPVPMVEGVQANPMQYAVSDSGSLVYVPGSAGDADNRILALVDRNGVVQPLNVPVKEYLSPRLSPDGQTLAVESVEDDGSAVWTYDLSGETAIRQLTFDGDNQWPIWTPDGQQLTFSSDRDGTMSLYRMPADGSGVAERLTTAEEGTIHWAGSWSPDGQTLMFSVQNSPENWDVWTLSSDSGEADILYASPDTTYAGADLSPDGQWLAYSAGPTGNLDIYVEPFPPTGARHRLSQGGGYQPLWSPDQRELFYRPLAISGVRTLMSADIATEPSFLGSATSGRCQSRASSRCFATETTTSLPTGNDS